MGQFAGTSLASKLHSAIALTIFQLECKFQNEIFELFVRCKKVILGKSGISGSNKLPFIDFPNRRIPAPSVQVAAIKQGRKTRQFGNRFEIFKLTSPPQEDRGRVSAPQVAFLARHSRIQASLGSTICDELIKPFHVRLFTHHVHGSHDAICRSNVTLITGLVRPPTVRLLSFTDQIDREDFTSVVDRLTHPKKCRNCSARHKGGLFALAECPIGVRHGFHLLRPSLECRLI